MEKILSITEGVFKYDGGNSWVDQYTGFVIETDKQTIKFGVSDYQSCCESYGSIEIVDDPQEFIGAHITQIDTVATDLTVKTLFRKYNERECTWATGDENPFEEENSFMFLNIHTDKGLLQLAVYNQHNGYYGHEAILISQQLTEENYI